MVKRKKLKSREGKTVFQDVGVHVLACCAELQQWETFRARSGAGSSGGGYGYWRVFNMGFEQQGKRTLLKMPWDIWCRLDLLINLHPLRCQPTSQRALQRQQKVSGWQNFPHLALCSEEALGRASCLGSTAQRASSLLGRRMILPGRLC